MSGKAKKSDDGTDNAPANDAQPVANAKEGKTFDIYHFKSRWDLILVALFLLGLLLVILYLTFGGGSYPA